MNLHKSSSTALSKPNSAIGFTAILNGSPDVIKKSQQTIYRALSHFDDINQVTLNLRQTSLTIWGRGSLLDCYYQLPDGSVLILIGSPVGDYSWHFIEEKMLLESENKEFTLPWEGRVIFLKISNDGNIWTIWNDWLGSIPIFYYQTKSSLIVSTLEPVLVETLNLTKDDFYLPGLISLLINGHFISDWTLYKTIKVCPPDCRIQWNEGNFQYWNLYSINPTDKRWEVNWDDLVDEMYTQAKQAVTDALVTQDTWTLPLSSGLDSRFIAGIAASLGKNIQCFTYGPKNSFEVIYAKQIANALDFPWKHINLGDDYLCEYSSLWSSIFGSAMHFHGMYFMRFLDILNYRKKGKTISGFLGDVLSDSSPEFTSVHTNSLSCQIYSDGWNHWSENEVKLLLKFNIKEAIHELITAIQQEINKLPGMKYQQMVISDLRTRQRFFTYFQTQLCDYWVGGTTPFINRNYANFCLSLPRAALDNRRLLADVFIRYFGSLSTIPGSYGVDPFIKTGRYLINRRIAKLLPTPISRTIYPNFQRVKLANMDITCVKKNGKQNFRPLFEHLSLIDEWINADIIDNNYQEIITKNDIQALRKLQSIQTLAYRLSPDRWT